MADDHTPNNIVLLLVALTLTAAIAAQAYPLANEDTAEVGEVLARITLARMEPGETEQLDFQVEGTYERIAVGYNITTASHVRLAFVDPSGERHEARAAGGALVLESTDPAPGAWRLEVRTLDEPGLHGHLARGEFVVLGFGGPRAPPGT